MAQPAGARKELPAGINSNDRSLSPPQHRQHHWSVLASAPHPPPSRSLPHLLRWHLRHAYYPRDPRVAPIHRNRLTATASLPANLPTVNYALRTVNSFFVSPDPVLGATRGEPTTNAEFPSTRPGDIPKNQTLQIPSRQVSFHRQRRHRREELLRLPHKQVRRSQKFRCRLRSSKLVS
jgi:hypothetical protein